MSLSRWAFARAVTDELGERRAVDDVELSEELVDARCEAQGERDRLLRARRGARRAHDEPSRLHRDEHATHGGARDAERAAKRGLRRVAGEDEAKRLEPRGREAEVAEEDDLVLPSAQVDALEADSRAQRPSVRLSIRQVSLSRRRPSASDAMRSSPRPTTVAPGGPPEDLPT